MATRNEKRKKKGLTTDELLRIDLPSFIDAVAQLSPASCEAHVRELLKRLDGPSYDEYVMTLVDVALTRSPSIDDYYLATRRRFPHVSPDADVLGRLCALAMKMAVDRLAAGREEIQALCDELRKRR